MIEFKGTKGKWKVMDSEFVTDEEGFSIANIDWPYQINVMWGEKGASHWNVKGFHREITDKEMNANALLISKAPEMLDLLKRCENWISNFNNNVSIVVDLQLLIKEATEL